MLAGNCACADTPEDGSAASATDAGGLPRGRLRIWTIGHSTRALEVFLAMLEHHGIRRLVDIRSWPKSRRHPQYDGDALRRALEARGIAYLHMPELGGRRGRQRLGRPSPNTHWRVEGFRNYADYALTPPFRRGLERLLALARERPTAIMCAEALPFRCHRRIVSDHLLARGVAVIHILDPCRSEPARMDPAAVVTPDGTVIYPGAAARSRPGAGAH